MQPRCQARVVEYLLSVPTVNYNRNQPNQARPCRPAREAGGNIRRIMDGEIGAARRRYRNKNEQVRAQRKKEPLRQPAQTVL